MQGRAAHQRDLFALFLQLAAESFGDFHPDRVRRFLSKPIAMSTLSASNHWRAIRRADIGFALMVRSYDIDRFAKHFAAEVFDGHTRCNDVARATKIGV